MSLLLASCSGSGSQTQTEATDSIAAGETVEAAVVAEEDPNPAIIREFYEKGVFACDTDYIIAHATPELIDKLRAANDYDDGGIAFWVLRSEAQDGDTDVQEVTGISLHGEDWYQVDINDMGNRVSVWVKVYDGKIADYQK